MFTGVDFIQKLLEYDPSKRMTLSDARHHPWLIRESELHRDTEYRRRTASPEPQLAIDASMRSIASDGMALDPQEGALMLAAPNGHGSSTPSLGSQESNGTASRSMLTRQPSRLQRRADVISHANEVGVALPGPSQEMQRRAIAEDDEEAGPPRTNKRKVEFDASLTPMEEEEEESEVAAPMPRRARAAAAAGKKVARGGKKAAATARVPVPKVPRKARANVEAAAESPVPRRSTRATTARAPSGPSPRKAAARRG